MFLFLAILKQKQNKPYDLKSSRYLDNYLNRLALKTLLLYLDSLHI